MTHTVHLGFEVGTGARVMVPVQHLAVTGQTQMSGKTTTLEALVARSGLSAIAFVTKRHEGSFRGTHNPIAPYFRERADWQFVSAVLEATLRERLKFERSWIMRACKGAKTLADVHANVRRFMKDAKGLSGDVYMTLDHYLDIVTPQISRLPYSDTLALARGLNVMDLSDYTTELQALVIRSVIEWVYQRGSDVLVIIPEAWEFVPQNRGSPVLLACEQLIRKGGAGGNYVWLDSQDIAGVHKNVLRSVGVWILGVQREANEVKRALAHIPGKKPTVDDVMQLDRGQFFACFGRTVVKTYVQPAWLRDNAARDIAMGRVRLAPPVDWGIEKQEAVVDEAEAKKLREENARLQRQIGELQEIINKMRAEAARTYADKVDPLPPPTRPPAGGSAVPIGGVVDMDAIYAEVKRRALTDADPKMMALFRREPSIEITKTVERIRVGYDTQPGVLAALIAEDFFASATKPASVIAELKRRGRAVHPANVSRDLGRLTEQGFLTKEGDGYQAVAGMKVHIIEREAAA